MELQTIATTNQKAEMNPRPGKKEMTDRRKLDKDYLSYLKALEYSRIWVHQNIRRLKQEIKALCIPQQIPQPKLARPTAWDSWQWKGKRITYIVIAAILFLLVLIIPLTGEVVADVFLVIWKIAMVIPIIATAVKLKNIHEDHKKAVAAYQQEQDEYNGKCAIDAFRINQERIIQERKENELTSFGVLLDKIKEMLDKLYKVNYIPFQHRSLQSIAFFESQTASSPLRLSELIRWKKSEALEGYSDIPSFRNIDDMLWAVRRIGQQNFWEYCGVTAGKLIDVLDEDSDKETELKALSETTSEILQVISERNYGMAGNVLNIGQVGQLNFADHGTINATYSEQDQNDNVWLQWIFSELIQQIKDNNRENQASLLHALEEKKQFLAKRENEKRDEWRARVLRVVEAFMSTIKVVGIAIETFAQFKT